MSTCCAIVTYGNRFHLLSKVINEVIIQGVNEIILVDNHSVAESQMQMDALAAQSVIPVKIIRFASNLGSANGFRAAMQAFLKSNAQFIWILDDDNKPVTGALEKLIEYWNNFQLLEKEAKLMLAAFRKDRTLYLDAIQNKNPDLVLPARNSFCGFHIKQMFSKIKERLFRISNSSNLSITTGKLNAAAYGGLFFHRKVLSNTLLPEPGFFLYMDDFAFTYSFVRGGGEIWLVKDSIIEDLEASFYLPKKKKLLYHSSLDADKDYLVYYALRNNVYFTLSCRINNRVLYKTNELIFLFIISITALLRGKYKRLKVIYDAVKDGKAGKLGVTLKYPL